MDFSLDDTIVAIASPPGGGARGIVRLSGTATLSCLDAIFEPKVNQRVDAGLSALEQPCAIAGTLQLNEQSRLPGMLYVWPDKRSFTRQPAAEFHTFGSSPLLQQALKTCCQRGARLARSGEFTLRAFLAGRMDLTQAEAVLSVIEADDVGQLRNALQLAAGDLRGQVDVIRDGLLNLLADLEAGLDFVDEDIEFIATEEIARELESASMSVQQAIDDVSGRQQVDDRLSVVLIGAPNAGKSSLINALVGRDVALVSGRAGTTRDYLEVDVELDGVPLRLIDTAGLLSSADFSEDARSESLEVSEVDAAAQRQTEFAVARADIVLECREPHEAPTVMLSQDDSTAKLNVVTKSDVVSGPTSSPSNSRPESEELLRTSALTGAGLAELRSRISNAAREISRREGRMFSASVRRCGEALARAFDSLETAAGHLRPIKQEELIAAEVRSAIEQLGEITGAFYTDDLLDRIFGRFCIGK